MVIPKKNVSGNSANYFKGNSLTTVCIQSSHKDNMGRDTHPFKKGQPYCSDPNLINGLELENVRGVLDKFVLKGEGIPYTRKKGYSVSSSQQDLEGKLPVEVRPKSKPLNLLKTPIELEMSKNDTQPFVVARRELKKGPKIDAEKTAFKGQSDLITAQIHELKNKSPLPDPLERRN